MTNKDINDLVTLSEYKVLCTLLFGEDSKATEFINKKIDESRNGGDEEVLADGGQMFRLLVQINGEGDED